MQQIDCGLLGNVLPNLRQQLSWAIGFWHVIVAARSGRSDYRATSYARPRLLFFAAKRANRRHAPLYSPWELV